MATQLSPHFSLEELATTAKASLAEENLTSAKLYLPALYTLASTVLESLRIAWGKPIKVNSGFRSLAVNTAVGGSKTSQHMLGQAADITTGNALDNKALWELALKLGLAGDLRFGQLILEEPSGSSWVHVSLGKPFRAAEGQVMKFNGSTYSTVRTLVWTGK
jgi:hypothetical protein